MEKSEFSADFRQNIPSSASCQLCLNIMPMPVLSSRPFESLSSRRRRWNASPTKPWLMFKEKIMEIRCWDNTRENQKCVLLLGNMTK